ncbi:LolA family protein [Acanthopleuribacter pedis]|uniref:Outer membrane lipoprotein carrier protein LolA n=1 Tax=Acanthopleuribacter pedis TaxID=442870 RepID=A0A8J7Q117_9BACT|nr:outer membrane lipoprotein carrier protein LolA [Acanthopleuribacter pedis]MBO1318442.1 outer membrane lipoprotein carrier protein LolA [Acanthopleuribacter pedis]
MNTARLLCLLVALVFGSAAATAQVSPKKMQCLQQALSELNRFETEFKQETYSDFFDPTLATGMLKVERPGKMRMDYRQGERKHVIWDGVTCYERDEMADTETRTPQSDIQSQPLVRLLLYGEKLTTYFIVRNGNSLDSKSYQLAPRGGGDYLIELELGADCRPKYLDILFEDGEGTRFWFKQIEKRDSFPATTFVVP